MICDLAEIYTIHGYRNYPLSFIATLASGLPASSRSVRAFSGFKGYDENALLTGILDNLNLLLWSKTKDAQNNRNRPKSLLNQEKPEEKATGFDSVEEYEKHRQKLLDLLGEEDADGDRTR